MCRERMNDTDFRNYTLMVHEAGHALGLSDFSIVQPRSYSVSHSTIPDAVMSYDSSTEVYGPDCSPYPFDLMTIHALYQAVRI